MKISVITVCLNAYPHVRDAIESVSSQSWYDLEYIVVDGASDDGTLEEIKRCSDSISRWVSEPDRGVYDAMNRGIRMASGDIIGFLNADDVYASPHIVELVAASFSQPGVDACYGDLVYVSPSDINKVVRYWKSGPFTPGLFARGWVPPHPTFYVRREIYQRLGGFDLSYSIGNDIELMIRFLEKYRINAVYLPEIMVKMRMGGISNRNVMNVIRQNIEIIRAARRNGIAVSPFIFLFSKIFSRTGQLITRPAPGKIQ